LLQIIATAHSVLFTGGWEVGGGGRNKFAVAVHRLYNVILVI